VRHPVYAGVLAVMWAIMHRRLDVADLLVGYVVASGVIWVCRDFWTERVTVVSAGSMLRLLGRFLKDLVIANLQVAWIVIQPRMPIRPALIELPLDLRDDLQITGLATLITLTPGTLTIDAAPDRSALHVHCLATDDPDAVRARIKRRFERPLQESVTCSPR
jgi:multisubunit Na+/H+ antiporter MnhE subunit